MSNTDTHEPQQAADVGTLVGRVSTELKRALLEPLKPGLYLVATPIGNLQDITLRALSVLAGADVIYCEDTRHSRTLVAHYGIGGRLKPYHEHNAEEQRPHVLAELAAGRVVALISDAGTPLISDPGYKLVRDVTAEGFCVISIPGSSAVLTALACAGLPTDAFFFAGFLPPRQAARRARLAELAAIPGTLVVFEAPTRVAECLADMTAILGDRPAALARELTKMHETVLRGTLNALGEQIASGPLKGEVVILAGPPVEAEVSDELLAAKLTDALQTASLRDASKAIAESCGVSRARVYDLGLAMKKAAGT